MHVRILGSAAGGGVPQWNCRCPNCAAARAGSPDVRPRTQSSVAVSADGQAWFLLNVSPDIRQQILAFPALGPQPEVVTASRAGPAPTTTGALSRDECRSARGTCPDSFRSSPIAGCVLTDTELDHTAGLLLLREGSPLAIHATATVRRWLNHFLPIEPLLASFSNPPWRELPLDDCTELALRDGSPAGLRVRAFEVDRHVPRFVREDAASATGSVVGLVIEDAHTGGRLVYAPCVASLGPLERFAREADCLLLDGTFWDDEEPIRSDIGSRTARAMGHLPVSGPEGSLEWLSGLKARHRVYVHINNTNPMLNERGPEHQQVTERRVKISADGDGFET